MQLVVLKGREVMEVPSGLTKYGVLGGSELCRERKGQNKVVDRGKGKI